MNMPRWSIMAIALGVGAMASSCRSSQSTARAKPSTAAGATAAVDSEPGNTCSGKILHLKRSEHLLILHTASGPKDFARIQGSCRYGSCRWPMVESGSFRERPS